MGPESLGEDTPGGLRSPSFPGPQTSAKVLSPGLTSTKWGEGTRKLRPRERPGFSPKLGIAHTGRATSSQDPDAEAGRLKIEAQRHFVLALKGNAA